MGQRGPHPARPQAGQHHRHREVVGGHRPADRQGPIQGLLDQPGRLRLVGHPERGVEIRLEGKLAQQGQTERVDGADGDLAQPVPQRPPAVPFGRRSVRRAPELPDDAIAHLRRRLPRERDGEDIGRIDARPQQIDVARHEDRGLAGTRRGLEDDVVGRIGGERPRRRVVQGARRRMQAGRPPPGRALALLEQRKLALTRHRRSPSGTRWDSRRKHSDRARRDAPETARLRSRRPSR